MEHFRDDRPTDKQTAFNQKNSIIAFVMFYDNTYNNEGNFPLILGDKHALYYLLVTNQELHIFYRVSRVCYVSRTPRQ